ncbi:type II CRISPR-associated endonuclease Cas1 [Akkermansia glycaniphila]|uniref:CRISPR-associated endonuclease Cas1 n=1 Tax=Akkermansia glycaniphila TaxID=1679444 RepID=A0A1H6LWF8_9BACT|nr:type II CRISPR-associated endonuclease Cas1 [Akkermansia glycaniphila]SEH89870.1 cas1 nmeni: crispr-associated endonuclease cas1 subtype ii/nmeni [Akkermansia glycaniphila]
MSYHILSIDAYTCQLSCERGQLSCISDSGRQSIPLEDVGAIIVSSFKATLTSNLIIEAAKRRIGFILCDSHKPAALILPADRATDTATLRSLATMPAHLKKRLWDKTLSAKCGNQAELATAWNPLHPKIEEICAVATSRRPNREADTARLFWSIFADTFADANFRRGRKEEGYNSLLNYAYAILLSSILQKLYALGLDPAFGIFHQAREHAAPLAYDLMEPFRPAFDANVARWIRRGLEQDESPDSISEITREYRRHIISTLDAETFCRGKTTTIRASLEAVCRSFRQAVLSHQSGPYEPWTISTIKWAGS